MANEFLTDEQTSVIQKLIHEIVNDPKTYRGSAYIPSVSIPARKIRTEVIEASGGLTLEHASGTDVKYIQRPGHRVQEFVGPEYKEAIHYNENDILWLRELGQQDTSKRGIRQHFDVASDRLNRRLEARIEYERWNAVFNGSFTYMGVTFSYGVPSQNRATPITAVWSSDGTNENNSSNPLKDIRYWTTGGYAPFRKYNITKMLMNGNTARWILDNTNTKAFVASIGANAAFSGSGFDLPTLLKFAIPGAPPVEIYNGWYQTESVDADGKISVGNAQYMIPDGYIYFESSLPGGDQIGEWVQGAHLATGTVDSPGFGKFFVVDDNIGPGTRGGPGNPFMDLVAGVKGGVNMQRAFDLLTAKVIA